MGNCLPQPCDGCEYTTGSVWCCPTTAVAGSGGGSGMLEGNGHPDDEIGTPTDPDVMWTYFDHDTHTSYLWSVINQEWK